MLTQPYAYANHNPLMYADPTGLILFAFDGTGNSDYANDPAMAGNGVSNVVRFRNLYGDGVARYVTGVGTVHRDNRYGNIVPDDFARNTQIDWLTLDTPLFYNDMGGNYSGVARVDRMMLYMRDEAKNFEDSKIMDVDVIGFSRGAAQARDFANRIVGASMVENGKTYFVYNDGGRQRCQWVNFRFMGLWDTVLSTNNTNYSYQLGIPAEFSHVAHAVALNEYRSGGVSTAGDTENIATSWALRNGKPYKQHMGGFPLESIGVSSQMPGQVRVEMGFIGAHADIGGGYPESENQLSQVTLNWMVAQAQAAHVPVEISRLPELPTGQTVLHDESNAIRVGDPVKSPRVPIIISELPIVPGVISTPRVTLATEDRAVRGAITGRSQRTMGFDGALPGGARSMTNVDTHRYISYHTRNPDDWREAGALTNPKTLANKTGMVDLDGYIGWLKSNNYTFVVQ